MFATIECNMEEFIAGCAVRFCPQCGKEIDSDWRKHKIGRPRTFCSDSCRRKFWKANPKQEQWASFEKLVCPVSGSV